MNKKKFVLKEDSSPENDALSAQVEEVKEQIAKQPVNFTSTAYSIVKLDAVWCVVEIPIDPVTQETGEWRILSRNDHKGDAVNRFKIQVAQVLIVV